MTCRVQLCTRLAPVLRRGGLPVLRVGGLYLPAPYKALQRTWGRVFQRPLISIQIVHRGKL